MAEEIMNELGIEIDEFLVGVGTRGCFPGNAEIFKMNIPQIKCIPVDPLNVRTLFGDDTSGTHRLEGMGVGFMPEICRLDLTGQIIAVKDEDAYRIARDSARFEGGFGRVASGATVCPKACTCSYTIHCPLLE